MQALKVIFTSKAIVLYDELSFISVHMYTCTLKFTVLNVSHYVVLTLDHMRQTSTVTLYKPHLLLKWYTIQFIFLVLTMKLRVIRIHLILQFKKLWYATMHKWTRINEYPAAVRTNS